MYLKKRATIDQLLWSFLLLAGLLAGALTPQKALADAALNSQTKTIVVGVELNFAPYVSVDLWGHPEGYGIDLLEAIARHADFQLRYEVGSWEKIRDELQTGAIDAVPLMAKTAERAQHVEFSDTHIVAYDAIFVRVDDNSIKSQADLKGKRVIVMSSDLADDYLRRNELVSTIIRTSSSLEAFKLLAAGQADAYITSQIVGLRLIESGNIKSVKLAEHSHFGDYQRDFGFAVKKGDLSTLNRLNEGLKAVVVSGEYRRIYDKWFSVLDPDVRRRTEQQRYLFYGLLAAILFAIVAAFFSFFLQREVSRKTKSLRESQLRFRGLVDNLPGVVFRLTFDQKWRLDFISDAVETLTGFPAEEFIRPGKRLLLSLLHPEDTKAALEYAYSMMLDFGRCNVDFRIIDKNGEVRWVNARGSTTADENLKHFDGIMLDITEQKRVTELLTLQQSKMASSARLSALGEMAGGIAHEINNPLAIINLRTHQLTQLAEKDKMQVSDIISAAESIEATSMRISRIIKSLQTVARESDHDPFEHAPVAHVIGDAVELCSERMRKHGVKLIVDPIPTSLEIECRRVQVSQVLINLFNNAFDAVADLHDKWVRVSAQVVTGTVSHPEMPAIEISVTDSGSAIKSEHSQKIFQPFFTTKGPGKGTGLGLSISKGMIESQDGNIFLDTDHETTRFVIQLPVEQPPTARHENTKLQEHSLQ
jgi:PAS domain S-box-containing protein